MPGTDAYGQNINLALLSDVPDAQQLASDLANGVVQRSIMRFASATNRGAVVTTPVAGMVTYLADSKTLEYYTGTAWRPLYEALPLLPRGRAASSYSTDGPTVGTITGTNLLWNAWYNGIPVLTGRRYRAHAAFTWNSAVTGMSAKIWIGMVPSTVALPGNGTGAIQIAYRTTTQPAGGCNQYTACSGEFNGLINGNINIGVYASKDTGLSGGFDVRSDPIELWIEDVGPAI